MGGDSGTVGTLSVGKAGATALEVLVGLILSGLVGYLAWRAMAVHADSVRWIQGMDGRLSTYRVARHVLSEDLRGGVALRDWARPRGDSVRIRAFRGFAVSCTPAGSDSTLLVHREGLRNPDPRKDSLLLLRPDGSWRAVDLVAVSSDPATLARCSRGPTSSGSLRLIPEADSEPPPLLARYFETGSYHLADGSFRYRPGSGGRQPLSREILADSSSGLAPTATGDGIRARLSWEASGGPGGAPGADPWVVTIWPRD